MAETGSAVAVDSPDTCAASPPTGIAPPTPVSGALSDEPAVAPPRPVAVTAQGGGESKASTIASASALDFAAMRASQRTAAAARSVEWSAAGEMETWKPERRSWEKARER